MIRVALSFAATFAFASPVIASLPPPPPSGPIFGTLECVFDDAVEPYTASFSFREDGRLHEALAMGGEPEPLQGYLQQFPFDADRVDRIVFQASGLIVVEDRKAAVMGTFAPLTRALRSEGIWLRYSTPGDKGVTRDHGLCFGNFGGRLERPITLTQLRFIRIDRVP